MAYLFNLPNGTTGIDSIVGEMLMINTYFPTMILVFIFLTMFIGGSVRQKTKTGTADYPAWAMVGSVATLVVALLMSINAQFIQIDWLVIVVALNIGSAFWFFLDKKVSEV